jgi:tetratricopeptide (TPR) repeat protein
MLLWHLIRYRLPKMHLAQLGVVFRLQKRSVDLKPRRTPLNSRKACKVIFWRSCSAKYSQRSLQTSTLCRTDAADASPSEQDMINSELDAVLLRLRIIAQETDIKNFRVGEIANLMDACLSVYWSNLDCTRAMRLWGVCKSFLEAFNAAAEAGGEKRAAEALGIGLERLGSDLSIEGYWSSAKECLLRTHELLGTHLHPSTFYNLAVISLYGDDKDLNECRLWIERGLQTSPQDEDLLLFLAQTFASEAKGETKKQDHVKTILALLEKVAEAVRVQKSAAVQTGANHPMLYNAKHAQLLSWALLKRKKGVVPYFDSFPYSPIDVTHHAVDAFSDDPESWAAHAKVLLDLQGLPSMLEAYEEGLKVAPSLELYWKYAVALISRQDKFASIVKSLLFLANFAEFLSLCSIRDGIQVLMEAETKSELLPPRFRREHTSDPDDASQRLGALSKFLEDELKLPFPIHWAKAFVASILAAMRGDLVKARQYVDLAEQSSAKTIKNVRGDPIGGISGNLLLKARFDEVLAFLQRSK